ncbi:transmembrane protein 2-like isoform X2 [Mizuhopecten yessoensis]|uniref:transmembrane protein 2-like isoform X2 n=1 Tax=Mizuhopecten yessoensis TaxID=6573 RepID=UPI000B45B3A3|nr:transmembrane protein 2-like isoform X2 [Mizuhopecten yessoensis]
MSSQPLLAILMVVASFSIAYGADCPWDDAGLELWSSLNADPNKVVKIDKGILYDVSSTDEFIGIEVAGGGKLVFKPNVANGLNLKTHYIIIKNGGRMDVGSEQCRYTGKLTIQLLGERKTINNLEQFGDKVIGVEKNGSLNICGEKKVSWTRLDGPLLRMPDKGMLFDQTVTQEDKLQGLIVYQFDPALPTYDTKIVNRKSFLFKTSSVSKFNNSVDDLKKYFDEVPKDHIVVAVIRKSLMAKTDEKNFQILYDVIANFLEVKPEESLINNLRFYDGYVMIKKKGDPKKMVEATSLYRTNSLDQVSEAVLFDGRKKFYAKSYTRIKAHGRSTTTVQVIDKDFSELTMKVSEDISSWALGSKLLITSTGNQEETEFATITELVDETHVKIDLTARFDHLCETYKGVRMCAEVALLDRNVLVEGVTFGDDQHGGNIKCLEGFASCNFIDFELNLMGSHFPLGRYPIHFHLAGDVTGKAVVDSLSIHNSYARCVVLHFTHNLVVKNTLCFECLGHGFFLEDGGEKGNKFHHNLAVAPRRAGLPDKRDLIPSDKHPSGFFVTNPDNEFEGNVAVAAEGYGFHFAFPKLPMGPSADLSNLKEGEALRTNLKLFRKNTAHSNVKMGVRIGVTLNEEGEEKWWSVGYAPRSTPTDDASDLAKLELSCVTAYNNGETNVQIRAAKLSLKNFSVAKGITGIEVLRSIKSEVYEQEIKDSIILGDREKGQAEGDSSDDEPRVGLEFIGPVSLSGLYFDDFYKSVNYPSGALGFAGGNSETITGNVMGDEIYFGFADPDDGSRVIGSDTNDDRKGNLLESFVDADGFVTDSDSAMTVLRNTPFQVTDNCLKKWDKYAVCEEEYAMVDTNRAADIFRVHGDTKVKLDVEKNTPFNVLANNPDYLYLVNYDAFNFAKSVNVRTFDANEGKKFVIGFCVPTGNVELKIQYSNALVFNKTESFNDLSTSSENIYFQDGKKGVVFVNFVGQETDSSSEQYCVDDYGKKGICRSLSIRVRKGVKEINDCIASAIKEYPTSQQPARRVGEQQKERKTLLTRTEKRLFDLIQKLEDNQSNYAERIAENQRRRLKRNVDPNRRTLDAHTGDIPVRFGASCDDSSKK